jgi:dienelactone hydrolase
VLHWLPDAADEGVGHSLKRTAKTFYQDATNLRRAVEWAATLPGVDSRRIGVLGVSRAAIATALVAQTSPAGGDAPYTRAP